MCMLSARSAINMTGITLNTKILILSCGLFFLISCLLLIETWFPAMLLSRLAAVLLFVLLLVVLFVNKSKSWPFLIVFWISHIWLAVSIAYLEFGYSPPEIINETFPSGATVRYVFYMSLFYLGCATVLVFFKMPQASLNKNVLSLYALFVFGLLSIVLVLCINGLIYGFPMLYLEQRFFYWESNPFGYFLSKFLAFAAYSSLISGYLYGINKFRFKRSNKLLVILMFSISIISILYANKFSWFFIYFICLIAGYITALYKENISINGKALINYVALVLVMGVFLISSVALSYKYVHNYETSDLIVKISTRVFQMQGQLWWSVDKLTMDGEYGEAELLIRPNDDIHPSGIFQIMELVMPNQLFDGYFASKVPLTGGFPATIIYNLGGLLGSLVVYLCGVLLGLVVVLFRVNLIKERPVRLVILLLLYMMLHWAYTVGSINIITSWVFMLSVFIVLYITILSLSRQSVLFRIKND